MSRARPYSDGNRTIWFDNRAPANAKHLELLADVEEVDLDDIFEMNLSQKQVLYRLHKADNLIPESVLEQRRHRREQSSEEPACRICTPAGKVCEGRITRHHFIPKWLMRELDHYNRYAARSKCTIPVCVGRHRDLHFRGENDGQDRSIVQYLTQNEKDLAEQMLNELKDERPAIFELLSMGDANAYEAQLIADYLKGKFRRETEKLATASPVDDRSVQQQAVAGA